MIPSSQGNIRGSLASLVADAYTRAQKDLDSLADTDQDVAKAMKDLKTGETMIDGAILQSSTIPNIWYLGHLHGHMHNVYFLISFSTHFRPESESAFFQLMYALRYMMIKGGVTAYQARLEPLLKPFELISFGGQAPTSLEDLKGRYRLKVTRGLSTDLKSEQGRQQHLTDRTQNLLQLTYLHDFQLLSSIKDFLGSQKTPPANLINSLYKRTHKQLMTSYNYMKLNLAASATLSFLSRRPLRFSVNGPNASLRELNATACGLRALNRNAKAARNYKDVDGFKSTASSESAF